MKGPHLERTASLITVPPASGKFFFVIRRSTRRECNAWKPLKAEEKAGKRQERKNYREKIAEVKRLSGRKTTEAERQERRWEEQRIDNRLK